MIYLDANATSIMPEAVQHAMVKWINKGNPSSSYRAARESSALIDAFRAEVLRVMGLAADSWYVLVTSGASESNSAILDMVANWCEGSGTKPHFVTTEIEHKSTLAKLEGFGARAYVTKVAPNALGFVTAEMIGTELVKTTVAPNLITIMSANNETGAMLNICAIARKFPRVPVYVDHTQMFGKLPREGICNGVDVNGKTSIPKNIIGFGMSMHKIGGPLGCGILVLRKEYVENPLYLAGLKAARPLAAQIAGSQNFGLRGGTEATHNIAASLAALQICMTNRAAKNAHLLALKRYAIVEMSKLVPCVSIAAYLAANSAPTPRMSMEVVVISGTGERTDGYLPNTLLISVVKRKGEPFCNVKMKKHLEANGVIVSIGSACNTSSKNASHVVKAMRFDEFLRKGVLRISFGDYNNIDDVRGFLRVFIAHIKEIEKK